jgi:hypothetical protein
MTAVTYGTAPATAATAAKAKSAKGFWARFADAFIAARMRQVEREMRTHVRFVPERYLKEAGLDATLRGSKDLPFVK